MKDRADPLLLSLLEKIANPIESLDLTVTLKGVFAPSQQWKQSDEANPNTFTYTLDVYNNLFTSGKIQPRKLTEKELKEQEEAKNKKGSKKEAKEEEKPQQQDPEAEKKRREWESLSEEERFFRTQEDPFKAFSLLWADNTKQQQLKEDSLKKLEDAVSAGELQIVLTRKPEGGQEEIAKLKKGKPKGLNLGELYAAQYTGKVNLKELATPGSTSTIQRVLLQFSGDVPADGIRIETEKCYALVELTLSQPINPEVKEQKPTARELLGESSSRGGEGTLLPRLAEQIRKGMRAISQEYSAYFAKEKDHGNEDRRLNSSNIHNLLSVSTLRINEISKRKDQFLSEFAVSGKYALLREKISKTVRAIVIDRCRKEKCGAAVAKQQLQKTLSELNVFLRQMAEKTLDAGVAAEATSLHQDLVLGHEYNRAGRKQTLNGVQESREDRETRLAHEYQIVNKIPEAEQKHINLVLLHNNSLSALENYAKFCLRHGNYEKAYALYTQISNQSPEFKYQLIISLFKAQRGREEEAISVLMALSEGEGGSEEKTLVHNLLSFLYERLGEEKKSEKHLCLAQKNYLLKANPHLKINPPKNPYLQPTPKVPKPGKYISQLTQADSQEMRFGLMNYLVDYNFYQLAKDYLPKLEDSDRKSQISAVILVSEGKFEDGIQALEAILAKDSKNLQLLLLKAEVCFLSEKLFECEEVFLYLLRLKPSPAQSYEIYLRLALTYLHRKSWEDAKATFNKAVELRPNSAAGWLGLGVANLRLSLLQESQEALNLSSIYNPLSSETIEYLKEIGSQVDSLNQSNYQYINGLVN